MIEPIYYPLLISIIDESYTDGLDRISSARLNEDGTALVVGMDGAKQIGVKISDSNIKIRILNPDPIDINSAAFTDSNIYEQLGMRLVDLALEAEFAAPKSKNNGSLKKKTCKTGLSCGGTCISKSKICARSLSMEQQKQFKELKKRLKAGDTEAQKGIDDLKDEQQGKTRPKSQESTKTGAKVEANPTNSEIDPMTIPERKKAFFVNIKDITSPQPASDFSSKQIEDLADSILASGGLYQPLLLKEVGTGKYEALGDGSLAYHASVRAKEKDLKRGEMVNGFIVADAQLSGSISQVKILEKSDNSLESNIDASKKLFAGRDDKSMYVNVKDISSNRPATDFDPKEIEDLADSILANGGLLRPMVLAAKGIDPNSYNEKYEVVSGHLAYHAAARAKEKNLKAGEMANGFVVSPENISKVIQQINLLNQVTNAK
jgi:hypothetical protein